MKQFQRCGRIGHANGRCALPRRGGLQPGDPLRRTGWPGTAAGGTEGTGEATQCWSFRLLSRA